MGLGQQMPVIRVKPHEKQASFNQGYNLQDLQLERVQSEPDRSSVTSRSSQSSRSSQDEGVIVKNVKDLADFLGKPAIKEWDRSTVGFKCHGLFSSPFRYDVNYTGLTDTQKQVLSHLRENGEEGWEGLISEIAQKVEIGDWAWKESSLYPFMFKKLGPEFSEYLKHFFLQRFLQTDEQKFNIFFHAVVQNAGVSRNAFECIRLEIVLLFLGLYIRNKVDPDRQINIGMYDHLKSTASLVTPRSRQESMARLVHRHMTVGEATQLCEDYKLYLYILPFRFDLPQTRA